MPANVSLLPEDYRLVPASVPPALAQQLLSAPVSWVRWMNRGDLHPNNYNPNKVAPPEMDLLEISILEDGFTQPIVISRHTAPGNSGADNATPAPVVRDIIVDGFHRFTVSGRPKIVARYGGYVPVVFLTPLNLAHQMLSTVRHNRARGTHGVLPMAEIVQAMIEVEGLSVSEIMERCQMEKDEVVRLANRAGIPQHKLITDTAFGQAWVPSK